MAAYRRLGTAGRQRTEKLLQALKLSVREVRHRSAETVDAALQAEAEAALVERQRMRTLHALGTALLHLAARRNDVVIANVISAILIDMPSVDGLYALPASGTDAGKCTAIRSVFRLTRHPQASECPTGSCRPVATNSSGRAGAPLPRSRQSPRARRKTR